ncbi:hypothetical protein SAMN05216262_11865 [Colwellia chukchiensis]|uniref:Uncharacterized protein n=2 Tax=Colwellia chukchiensis TaxID=641665 RepID=A0A1H7SFY3_9GAMM|nr:hypothetical protein SAMN05216262_11865 [Colwellia chukchiensis]
MRQTLMFAVYLLLLLVAQPGYSAVHEISFALPSNKLANKPSKHNGKILLLLPVPQKKLPLTSKLRLNATKQTIAANFKVLATWPSVKGQQYIRLLAIDINVTAANMRQLTLSWSSASHALNVEQLSEKEYHPRQLVYPSRAWLLQTILLHPAQTVASDWYLEPQKKYAHYVTNQALLRQKGYPAQKATQWLYDRPQAIYQLYLMSGDEQWLNKANALADFYINHIDENGIFKLKKRFDPKMLMPKGVLYRYLLSGDVKAKAALTRMFEKSLDWQASYRLTRGFWTERNQAAALNVAISYWELTGEAKALQRINELIDATVAMTFNPVNNWPLRGCPQHSFKAHEGWGDNSAACSPWMMALLGDALWRFYLLTEDQRAAALLDSFGDFVLNYGIYYGNERVKNIVIPKYIVSIDNPKQEELNQWTDPQHACDVAALLGKSTYIKQQNKQDDFLVKTLFSALLEQCAGSYLRLKQEQKSKREKHYWVLKPPRRFAWMYSTTSDLPWLKEKLLAYD